MLASTTVNRWVARRVRPAFDYRWTLPNALSWAWLSLPSAVLAAAMALFVPRLASLTGLLDSIAGATLQITALPLCLWATTNAQALPMRARVGPVALLALATYGVIFMAAVLASAAYLIGTTRYSPVGNETYWCDVAAAA